MASNTDNFMNVAVAGSQTTLAAPGKSIGAGSINITSASGWPTTTGIIVALRRVDSNGNYVSGTYTEWAGVLAGTTITLNTTPLYGTDQTYAADGLTQVYIPVSASLWNRLVTGLLADHFENGGHGTLHDTNGNAILDLISAASAVNNLLIKNGATGKPAELDVEGGDTNINLLQTPKGSGSVIPKLASPQGYLINGQISVSVASNNLTVAIKTLDNNTPSATNPVYIRIGNTVRSITAALSLTLNAGTNYFSKGADIFATNESDYFVYLVWNTNQTAVQLAISSTPGAVFYSDFSTTNTAWNYFAGSSGSAPASTDQAEVIGRFGAILGASASYNWSLPGTLVQINYPIFETRVFSYTNGSSGGGTFFYQQVRNKKMVWGNCADQTIGGAAPASASVSVAMPAGFLSTTQKVMASGSHVNNAAVFAYVQANSYSTSSVALTFFMTVGTAGVFNAALEVTGT